MPIPTDPLLNTQWYLGNTGGLLDLNVRGVWNPASGSAYTGSGIRVVIIDDGFDYTHSDLAPNFDTSLDIDFDEVDTDALGAASDIHGTAVIGIIGADNNGTGAVGIAFDSSLVGYRIHGFISDLWLQNIRDSIQFAAVFAQGDVANISQGLANDINSEFGTGYNTVRFDEIEASIGTAVTSGRGGLGMTIVKSAGNSRFFDYDVNADDWANDTRQVVVAAVDQNGFVSSYSSYGAAILVSAFGTPGQVVTTDRVGVAGYDVDDFTETFSGTSAAAPMVTGVVSLMYDANANLGWRDVQGILANSARHVGSAVDGFSVAGFERYVWQWNEAGTWNGGGLHFSNDYGYGLVDALAAVRLAETWLIGRAAQTSGNEHTNSIDMLNSPVVIPDGNTTGLSFSGNAAFDDEVERVTVSMTFSTTFTGDMELYLTSPDGTVSELIDDTGGATQFNGTWTFETQAFRGERAAGTWTVRVVDDAGLDALVVSDIVVTTFGRSGVDDRYVFTNEYSDYAGIAGHLTSISDVNGGLDTVNAAAVSTASIIRLDGLAGQIDGMSVSFLSVENAIGGVGDDTIHLSNLNVANLVHGRGGSDTVFVSYNFGSGYTIQAGSTASNLIMLGSAGSDALVDCEFVHFANGTTVSTALLLGNPTAAPGDFNGDGTSDILWRNTNTGTVSTWFVSNGVATQGVWTGVASLASQISGAGDFDGDGRSDDILWRDTNTGTVSTWLVSNGVATQGVWTGVASLASQISGVGDFDGDGRSDDILWRDTNTGTVSTWFVSNGVATQGVWTGVASLASQIAGVGDFDGDGRSDDILWRDTNTGTVSTWFVSNGVATQGVWTGVASLASQIAGVGDFDGDGRSDDILWRDTNTGTVSTWFVSNGVATQGVWTGVASLDWMIDA